MKQDNPLWRDIAKTIPIGIAVILGIILVANLFLKQLSENTRGWMILGFILCICITAVLEKRESL